MQPRDPNTVPERPSAFRAHVAALAFACLALTAGVLTAQSPRQREAEIAAAIERELRHDPAVASETVEVSVRDGIAILAGSAATLLEKERAVWLAETVRGVRAVIAELDVQPVERSDAAVREDVEQALRDDPATDAIEVAVEVIAGAVTLTGSVESWTERSLAGRVATGVRGVGSVENAIDVALTGERSDAEVRADVEQRLFWDALVGSSGIDVTVVDGEARLSGFVGSAAEKHRARDDAWVRGVTRVSTDDLEVIARLDDEQVRDTVRGGFEDDAVETAIRLALRRDPRVTSSDIEVDFRHAVATLDGRVTDAAARRAAERAASDVVGVVRVINDIDVAPPQRDASAIRESVRAALRRDAWIESYELAVDVRGQDVILTGIVESWFEKLRAADLAAAVRGVDRVRNRVQVLGVAPYVYEPYLEGAFPYAPSWYDYRPGRPQVPDFVIENDIELEFRWSPFLDTSRIEIEVNDGVARLSGTVPTFAARRAATENAYEGGAVWVANDLELEPRSVEPEGAAGGGAPRGGADRGARRGGSPAEVPGRSGR